MHSTVTHAGDTSDWLPYGALGALLLCAVIPAWVVMQTGDGSHSLRPLAPLLLTLLFGLRYAWVIACGRVALFEMSAWLFAYIFMGIAPLVQLRERATLNTTPYVNFSLVNQAHLVVLVGALCLMFGSSLAARPQQTVTPGKVPARTLSSGRVRLLCASSWIFTAVWVMSLGGPTALFKSRFEVSDAASAAFQNRFIAVMVTAFANMATLVSTTAIISMTRATPRSARRPIDLFLCATQTFLLLVTINPISSPRYVFGTALLALAGSYGGYAGLGRFRMIAVAALAGFLVIFPALDSFRVSTTSGVESVRPLQALLSGDFDGFYQTLNAVEYVREKGNTHGRQIVGVLLFAIPRKCWPDKPTDTGILLAEYKGYHFTNLSAPIWAEMYVNGGWIFLVLSMTLIGIALRRADDSLDLRVRHRLPLSPGHLILPFYMLILMRGSLLQAAANLSILLLCWMAIRAWPEARVLWRYLRTP